MKVKIKIRIFLWCVLSGITIWLLWQAVVPLGEIIYTSDLSGNNYFIRKLTPAERVEMKKDEPVRIIGDPVYFSLRTPRRFDQAKIILTFKYDNDISSSAPIIETGVLKDKIVWRYDLKPVKNKIIDELAKSWNVIKDGDRMLLQREKKFNSLNEFLTKLPARNETALYNYDLKTPYLLKDYASSTAKNDLGFSLRGDFQFYAYIKNEDLKLNFDFVDLNKNNDADSVDIYLYFDNALIDSRHLDDDGVVTDNGEENIRKNMDFTVSRLPEGVYKIEVRANDDIVTKKLNSPQKKLSFINKIWIWENNDQETTLYTDSGIIQAVTSNPASLGKIKFGQANLELKETYRQYDSIASGSPTKILLPRGDITISGDGVFSPTAQALIDPAYRKITPIFSPNRFGINYILADYRAPEEKDGWRVAGAEFDLTNAYRENGAYSFLISVPGLKAEEADDYIEIKGLEVELKGKTLWSKIKEIFNDQ